MAKNRFPKQGTEGYCIFFPSVVKVVITKKWMDLIAYIEPTQVATTRVVKIFSGKAYNIGSKIIIDDPEDLILDEKSVIREILGQIK